MIDKIHTYEYANFAVNHPVGMSIQYPSGNVTTLKNSDAEWISFGGSISNPPINNANEKVVIADTDHVCGTCSNTEWGWRSLTRGQQQMYMDPYDMDGHSPTETGEVNMRTSLKYVQDYSGKIDLKHAVPSTTQSSTGYALVNDGTAADDQYMVFAPDGGTFTVDLTNTSHNVVPEWLNTDTYATSTSSAVSAGSSGVSFTSPWGTTNSALLILKEIDTTNPTVSVTAPTASATVSGSSVTLTATASDNRAVAGVQFKVDGTNVGSEDTVSPYTVNWDSTAVGNGSHTVTAVARDAAANSTTSSGVSVTVSNVSTGLVAAYGFNNSGSPRADNSGNGYTLDCGTTCATYSSTGGHGTSSGAYDFSGTNDWLEIPSESPFDFTTNLTVEFWFKTPSPAYSMGSSWGAWVAKGDSSWSLGRYGSYDSPSFITYSGATEHDGRSSTYNTDDLNDGAWHHFAATYDGSYKKLYVDGTLVNTYSYTSTLNTNNYKVSFGKDLESGTAQYAGMLDDVRIYNRALSGTEVGTDMSTPVN
jgi:hypothetical protein